MQTEAILEVSQLTKTYSRGAGKPAFSFPALLRDIVGFDSQSKEQGKFAALDHVNFKLDRGDVLGIIGRNGVGKTTLLKILSGIVKASSGTATYYGRMVSILDFGSGFHPDLTGFENIKLNAALLGMSKTEIKEKIEEIIDFSELREFIHDPVKNYSNGMYLRLAFSIFTHVEADILLLDEVISVGDFPFRQKCYKQISKLARSGATILMVSHFPDQVKDLCNKCLWLEHGKLQAFGATKEVLDDYLEKYLVQSPLLDLSEDVSVRYFSLTWSRGFNIQNQLRLFNFQIKAKNKDPKEPIFMNDELIVEIEFEKLTSEKSLELTISIRSMYEAWVLVDSYGIYNSFHKKVTDKGRYSCTCTLPAGVLNFGIYQLGLLVSLDEELIYQNPYLLNFQLEYLERESVKNDLAREARSILRPYGEWQLNNL